MRSEDLQQIKSFLLPLSPSSYTHSHGYAAEWFVYFWMLDFMKNCWYSPDKVKYKAMTPVIQGSQRLNVKWPKVGKMHSAIGFGKIAKRYLTVGSFEAFQCQRGLNLEHNTNKEALGAPRSVPNHVTLRAKSLHSSQTECHSISACITLFWNLINKCSILF